MRARIALLTLLTALVWTGAVFAQSYDRPPSPPRDRDSYNPPPPQDYGDYDNGEDDQDPYYGDQGALNPNDRSGDDGYFDQGDNDQSVNHVPVDITIFYGNLSPYGRWLQRGSYGWVWEPTHVRVGWRPYTEGRWVSTDYGWTWISDEPWGWATYHYGRWLSDPEYGWLWVPGTEWGPAWVSFQEGNGYIGWAPLPPAVGFLAGFGLQIGGFRLSADIDASAYCFLPARSFLSARVSTVILPLARNVTLIRATNNITNISVVNHRIRNQSFAVGHIEQLTGQRVQRYRIAEVRDPGRGPRGPQIEGNRIHLIRPAETLARPRGDVSPQAIIQHRERERGPWGQRGQDPRGQDPQGRPQRWQQQPDSRQPQPGQPPPADQDRRSRWPSRLLPQDELNRKHQDEQRQLQERQNEERNRIQRMHEQDQGDRRNPARAQDVEAQHQVEIKALEVQSQREQQLLKARQQREEQATQARRQRGPEAQPAPDRRGQDPGQEQRRPENKDKGKDREKDKDKDNQRERRERRPEPPPPPPPGR